MKKLAAVLAAFVLSITAAVALSPAPASAASCTTMKKRAQVEVGMRMQVVHDILDHDGFFQSQTDVGLERYQTRLYNLCDLTWWYITYRKTSPDDTTWQVYDWTGVQ
jgi:hypothetical protein